MVLRRVSMNNSFKFFYCVIALLWLSFIALPWAYAANVGSLILIDSDIDNQKRPDIAYNNVNSQYLIVWQDETKGAIVAEIRQADGTLVKDDFVVAQKGATDIGLFHPAVTYKEGENAYLVIWNRIDSTGASAVWGRIIDSAGNLTGTSILFGSAGTSATPVDLNVSADHLGGLGGTYFGAWTDASGNLKGRIFNAAGKALSSVLTIVNNSGGTAPGPPVTHPSVEWNGTQGVYLVIYQRSGYILAKTVSPVSPVTISSHIYISGMATAQKPDVAWDGGSDEYLVVWVDSRNNPGEIWGQRLNGDATLAGGNFLIDDANFLYPSDEPAVVADLAAGHYSVTYQSMNGIFFPSKWATNIYIRRVNKTGPSCVQETVYYNLNINDITPAIAYGGQDAGSLIVWDHNTSTANSDIYGQRIAPRLICNNPVITSVPLNSAIVGKTYLYDAEASDQDGDPLAYSLTVSPPDMTIVPATGLIQWIPAISDEGDHTVTVRVEDGTGGFNTQTYTLSVSALRYTFTGHVYQGNPPDLAPFAGVTVELYGDADERLDNGSGNLLASSVTNGAGEFSLNWVDEGLSYPNFHVIERNPFNCYSTGVQAGASGYIDSVNVVSYNGVQQGVYSGIAFWDNPFPLYLKDFGPSAERIRFDNIVRGTVLSFQLTMQGVLIQSEDGTPVQIVDKNGMGGGDLPLSDPNAVSTALNDVPLEIQFLTPKNRVGVYFFVGHIDSPVTAVLKAYDKGGVMISESLVTVPARSLRDTNSYFIGVDAGSPVIDRVTLNYEGIVAAKIIDDLIVEPSQDGSVSVGVLESIAYSPHASKEEKLEVINALQLQPSGEASRILQDIASNDYDLYVRERAIMALTQIWDPDSIPALVGIGMNPPDSNVRIAAYNAVWALRQIFPLPDPPIITIEAINPIMPGTEFDVEARVVLPVNRDNVTIGFLWEKPLIPIKTDSPMGYKGKLVAHEPLFLRKRFLAQDIGQTKLELTVRISLNKVDATTYRVPLYINIQQDGGTATMTVPPGIDEINEYIVPIN